MAVVGEGYAFLQSYKVQLKGYLAWLVWARGARSFLGPNGFYVERSPAMARTYLTPSVDRG
jgi:hypothetical protein